MAAFAGDPEAAPDLRFFDLLTLACEALLADAGVDVAVVEAGLGGRLDASRVLLPKLVVLTGIDLDHTELLGPTREHILIEKLAVAPPGALVLAGGLDDALAARAAEEAERLGVRLELVEPETSGDDARLPPFLRENVRLARRGAERAHEVLGTPPHEGGQIMLDVRGRFEQHTLDGVETLVDAAHNPQAFRALLAAAAAKAGDRPLVALVALGADRDPDALARPCATPRRSAPSWPRPSTRGPRAVPARSLRPSRGPACRSRWSPIRRSPGATRCSTRERSTECSWRSVRPTCWASCPPCRRLSPAIGEVAVSVAARTCHPSSP